MTSLANLKSLANIVICAICVAILSYKNIPWVFSTGKVFYVFVTLYVAFPCCIMFSELFRKNALHIQSLIFVHSLIDILTIIICATYLTIFY